MGLSTTKELWRCNQTNNGFEQRNLTSDGFEWIEGWTTVALSLSLSLSLSPFLFSVYKILFEGNLNVYIILHLKPSYFTIK